MRTSGTAAHPNDGRANAAHERNFTTGRHHAGVRRVAFGALLLLVASFGGAAHGSLTTLPRVTADRPDEVQGAQVHAVYAVPSDGADRALDTSGAVAASVDAFQRWLARETGGPKLRLDTSGGELDVTFVRLPKSDAEIASRGAFVRDELESLLGQAGHLRAGKLYAVYYDGRSTFSCGGGAWPPRLPGRVAAMYLRGEPPGATPCSANPLAAPGGEAGYMDIAMLHELVHTLGFVAECAPHHTRSGHTSDSPNDLMWAGDAPWQLPPRLDIGRDDYYGHGRPDCPDLARSEFLTSFTPPPPPPPEVKVHAFDAGPARPGRRLEARLSVTVDGAPARTGRARCTARLGRRAFRAQSARFVAGTAVCRWRVPSRTRGKRITGTVTAIVEGVTLRRSFRRVVR
jgi:hypothetical protein